MTLDFEAKFVDCADAIGGEILQVSFDTVPPSHDKDERCTPYVLISRNFEFPDSATVEWHDGKDYDGGAEITSVSLKRDRISIKLDRDLGFEVAFRLHDRKFARLRSFLRRMIDDRICITE
jgi:hypothetical protein